MTPTRRHPDAFRVGPGRREITVAVLAALGVLVFTGVMLWALGPHDGGGDSSPTPTVQTTPTTAPTSAPAGDTAATSAPAGDTTATSAPVPTTTATSAPAATTAAPSTAAPGGG